MPVYRGRPDPIRPPRKQARVDRSPIAGAARGAYVLTSDTSVDAREGAAVGFRTVPANTPNPTSQNLAGQILLALARADAQNVGNVAGVQAFAYALPLYFGWADLALWAEVNTVNGSPGLWWYVTNGRDVPTLQPNRSAALRTQFNGLTMIAGAGSAATVLADEPIASPGGGDDWPTEWGRREHGEPIRLWLPPGQNDLFIFCDGGDGTASANCWFTMVASPATEAAVTPAR